MKTVTINCNSVDRLEGFAAGIEWVNDSATRIISFEETGHFSATMVVEDGDGEEEYSYSCTLTENGLEEVEVTG